MVRELDLNIEDDSFLVTDLSPTTLYTFSAELTNRFGTSQPVTANANTTVGKSQIWRYTLYYELTKLSVLGCGHVHT